MMSRLGIGSFKIEMIYVCTVSRFVFEAASYKPENHSVISIFELSRQQNCYVEEQAILLLLWYGMVPYYLIVDCPTNYAISMACTAGSIPYHANINISGIMADAFGDTAV